MVGGIASLCGLSESMPSQCSYTSHVPPLQSTLSAWDDREMWNKDPRPAVESRVAVALDCLVGRSPQDECGEGTCKLEHRRLYCTLPDILENAAYDAESYIDCGS
jgi:hypothetical protein